MIKINKQGKKQYYYYIKKDPSLFKKRGPKPLLEIIKHLPPEEQEKQYLNCSYNFFKKYTKKYKNKKEFEEKEPLIYKCCLKLGFIENLYPYGDYRYNFNECKEICKKYESSDELLNKDSGFYMYIVKRKWIQNIFSTVKEKYTRKNCYICASQYKLIKNLEKITNNVYILS